MIKYLLVNFLKNRLGLFQLSTVSVYKQMPLIYLYTPQKVDIISIEKYVLRILHSFHQLKSEI